MIIRNFLTIKLFIEIELFIWNFKVTYKFTSRAISVLFILLNSKIFMMPEYCDIIGKYHFRSKRITGKDHGLGVRTCDKSSLDCFRPNFCSRCSESLKTTKDKMGKGRLRDKISWILMCCVWICTSLTCKMCILRKKLFCSKRILLFLANGICQLCSAIQQGQIEMRKVWFIILA